MDRGVIYIAFGERYVAEAVYSATTLKAFNSLPVTIFTDIDTKADCFDSVVLIAPEHKRAKVDFISRSPYERTLYLDSDTKIAHDIADLFDVLDKFDVAAVHDHSRKSNKWSSKIEDYAAIPYAFPEYNGGVLLYKNTPDVATFFDMWRHYFYKNIDITNGKDQASLRISLWNSGVRVHSLPFEYNVRNEAIRRRMKKRSKAKGDEALLKPRIFHWHGLHENKLFAGFRRHYKAMKY